MFKAKNTIPIKRYNNTTQITIEHFTPLFIRNSRQKNFLLEKKRGLGKTQKGD